MDEVRETAAVPLVTPDTSPRVSGSRYVIEGEVARGGMGVVLRATDRLLQRTVALKVPREAQDLAALHRLEMEGKLVAGLQHPAILSVYDAGVLPDGRPFFAMALLPSQTFAAAIETAPTPEARLRLLPRLATVAEGVAAAHRLGVVHRDLKPENVLLGELGETVIIDWGIARRLNDGRPGASEGTRGYAAPEQERGEPPALASDVFSLGVILQELIGDDGPAELRSVARECLKVDPAQRPRAALVAECLRARVGAERVALHDYSLAELASRWSQRHRTAVSVGAAAVVLLALVSTFAALRVTTERNRAMENLADSRASQARLLSQSAEGRLAATRLVLDLQPPPTSKDAQRSFFAVATAGPLSWPLEGHLSSTWLHAWTPDSQSLLSVSVDGTLSAWTRFGKRRWRQSTGIGRTDRLQLAADGSSLLVRSGNEVAWFRVRDDGADLLLKRAFPSTILSSVIRIDGREACAGLEGGQVVCMQANGTSHAVQASGPVSALSEDGWFGGTADGSLFALDGSRNVVWYNTRLPAGSVVQALAMVGGGPLVVTTGDSALLYDARTLDLLGKLDTGGVSVRALAISRDQRWLAVAAGGGVLLYEPATVRRGARPTRVVGSPGGDVEFREWMPFVSNFGVLAPVLPTGVNGPMDERADQRVLDIESSVEFARLSVVGGAGYEGVVSGDGTRVLTCSTTQCRIWGYEHRDLAGPLARFDSPIATLDWLADGGWAATSYSGQRCEGRSCSRRSGRLRVPLEVTMAAGEWSGEIDGVVTNGTQTFGPTGAPIVALQLTEAGLVSADSVGHVRVRDYVFHLDAGLVDARWDKGGAVALHSGGALSWLSSDGGIRTEPLYGSAGRMGGRAPCVAISTFTHAYGWLTACVGRLDKPVAGVLPESGDAISPDGRWLATSLPSSTLAINDLREERSWNAAVPAGIGPVVAVDIREAEVRALTRNGVLAVFALDGGALLQTAQTPPVDRARFSADGLEVLVATNAGLIWRGPLTPERQLAWLCLQSGCADGGIR